MKYILVFLLALSIFACNSKIQSQSQPQSQQTRLSISPFIDQKDSLNQKIILTVEHFLATQNTDPGRNEYWEENDFDLYIYPYSDLNNIEANNTGRHGYLPTLLEIIDTDSIQQKIVKLAFIKHDSAKQENQLMAIYNLIANQKNGQIIFSSYINYATRKWEKIKMDDITYILSPLVKYNVREVEQQQLAIKQLQHFFQTDPIPLTYYSCMDPVELFQTRGFDYIPNMYMAKTGGLVYPNSIIFAGNNSQLYTHEIAHLYQYKRFPSAHILLNEGLATFLGGTGPHSYAQCKAILKQYLTEHPDFRIDQYTDPYEPIYANKETSVPYVIGALICERTIRHYSKEKLFELLQQKGDLKEILQTIGLTSDNLNHELRLEANLPPLAFSSYSH